MKLRLASLLGSTTMFKILILLLCQYVFTLWIVELNKKNPAHRRHWISRPLRIVSPLQWRKKKFNGGIIIIFLYFFLVKFFFGGVLKTFLLEGSIFFFFFNLTVKTIGGGPQFCFFAVKQKKFGGGQKKWGREVFFLLITLFIYFCLCSPEFSFFFWRVPSFFFGVGVWSNFSDGHKK